MPQLTFLNEGHKRVQVFVSIPTKESIETLDFTIDFILQNASNTDANGVVVEQILEDFAVEHKFTCFPNSKPTKIEDIQYYCSFCSLNWENVDEFMEHKCTDGKVQS